MPDKRLWTAEQWAEELKAILSRKFPMTLAADSTMLIDIGAEAAALLKEAMFYSQGNVE